MHIPTTFVFLCSVNNDCNESCVVLTCTCIVHVQQAKNCILASLSNSTFLCELYLYITESTNCALLLITSIYFLIFRYI